MKILLVNPGRHICFSEQIASSDIGADKIYIAENNVESSSCVHNKSGENIKISPALDDGFIPDLLKLCADRHIDFLFSFIDYGLDKLASNAPEFKKIGTDVVVSSLETVRLCEDKYEFCKFLNKSGLSAVPTFIDGSIMSKYSLPYFAKPRYGNSSQGAVAIENSFDLEYYLNKKDYIVQPFVKEREFGIDMLVKGKQIYDIFMKEKLKLRAGTTDVAISAWDKEILRQMEQLVSMFEFNGPIDVDILKKGDRYYINEVNPRFGGGYASAALLGKNFFARYIKERKNDRFLDYQTGVKTVRHEVTLKVS